MEEHSPWPAAACSPGRACPPTATPGNSGPFCLKADVCPHVVCSAGLTRSYPALRTGRLGSGQNSPPGLQPAPSREESENQNGGTSKGLLVLPVWKLRPIEKGDLFKKVVGMKPKPNFLSGALSPVWFYSPFVYSS